jgi:hypothetical protein
MKIFLIVNSSKILILTICSVIIFRDSEQISHIHIIISRDTCHGNLLKYYVTICFNIYFNIEFLDLIMFFFSFFLQSKIDI